MAKYIRPAVSFLLLCGILFLTAGCAKNTSKDVRIELEALDGADVSVSNAVFPVFVSGDEDFQKELDKFNREVDKIREQYEKRREKNKEFIVHTHVRSVKSVPQCTIAWYEEHSLLGDDYNLMTLAVNTNTGELITSKEALKSHEIDGVTLSTEVGRLYEELYPTMKIKETEMQGFETDESGAVTGIYMKLTARKREETGRTGDKQSESEDSEEEIHFYYYDPAAGTLQPLSELGFNTP